MEQRKTYEKSYLIITDEGKEKREQLVSAIDEIAKADPDERFILVDPKRVELEEYEKKVHLVGKRVKEPREVEPLLKKLLKDIQERKAGKEWSSKTCLVIAEYGDIHDRCPECDDLVLRILQENYEGIRLVIATQREREMKKFVETLKKEGKGHE